MQCNIDQVEMRILEKETQTISKNEINTTADASAAYEEKTLMQMIESLLTEYLKDERSELHEINSLTLKINTKLLFKH